MSNSAALHPSIVALVSLAANIAANHPKKGLCQLERLRSFGIAKEQIDMVVDIARHIRDEAGQMLDAAFEEEAQLAARGAAPAGMGEQIAAVPRTPTIAVPVKAACCTPTAKGNSCC